MESLIIQKKMGANITIPEGFVLLERRKWICPLIWHAYNSYLYYDRTVDSRESIRVCKTNDPELAMWQYVPSYKSAHFLPSAYTLDTGYPNNREDNSGISYSDPFNAGWWTTVVGTHSPGTHTLTTLFAQGDQKSIRLYHVTSYNVSSDAFRMYYDGYYTRDVNSGGELIEYIIAPDGNYGINALNATPEVYTNTRRIQANDTWIQKVS